VRPSASSSSLSNLQNIWEEGCWVANQETVLYSVEEDSQLEIAD
jgi:hypothetical protein